MQEIIFTRCLYLKKGIIESLKKKITLCHINDSLFWAYELYESGFEEEVMNILYDHAISLLGEKSPFIPFILKKKKEKKQDRVVIATIVKNLILEYQKKLVNKSESKRFIAAKYDEIIPFVNMDYNVPHYRKLRKMCNCQIDYNYLTIDEAYEVLDAFRNDWLKYAVKSPIWKKRIEEFGGIIQRDGSVLFSDDDTTEDFYKIYGYEPDEQKVEIYEKCLGIKVEKVQ